MASKDKHKEKPPPPSAFFFFLLSSHKDASTMKPSSFLRYFRFVVFVVLCYLLWLRLIFYTFPPAVGHSACRRLGPSPTPTCDPAIAPFYIHKLHPRFNSALLQRCLTRPASSHASCPHLGHRGLGRPLLRLPGGVDDVAAAAADAVEATSWYATHPLAAELLFHARAERHPCRTLDPAAAVLFFVPFYAGLHAAANSRQRNHTLRDALAEHLADLPAFRRHGGRDHFLAVGRASREFMRDPANPDSGANRLLLLPELANMTVLTVERDPRGARNQFGIPYPSYFHPRTAADVAEWQAELRGLGRDHLFAIVGGGQRPGSETAEFEAGIMRQCWRSRRCLPVDCEPAAGGCGDVDRVLDVMRRADFCLQPPAGDSQSMGRSAFDSVLAGCIPVFFSERTAYEQYEWYLPEQREGWSVLLKPEQWGRVEEELARIPTAEVERMREAVVELIPRMAYAHPESNPAELGFRDAVDVALVELTKRVRSNLQYL